jgi:hypothetical protein
MEIKKNKKCLNVLKSKIKLRAAVYFVLKIKGPKQETVLKSSIKYLPNISIPFDFKRAKFPTSINVFKYSNELFDSAEEEKTNIILISFKDIFLRTTHDLKLLRVMNIFMFMKSFLYPEFHLFKLLISR